MKYYVVNAELPDRTERELYVVTDLPIPSKTMLEVAIASMDRNMAKELEGSRYLSMSEITGSKAQEKFNAYERRIKVRIKGLADYYISPDAAKSYGVREIAISFAMPGFSRQLVHFEAPVPMLWGPKALDNFLRNMADAVELFTGKPAEDVEAHEILSLTDEQLEKYGVRKLPQSHTIYDHMEKGHIAARAESLFEKVPISSETAEKIYEMRTDPKKYAGESIKISASFADGCTMLNRYSVTKYAPYGIRIETKLLAPDGSTIGSDMQNASKGKCVMLLLAPDGTEIGTGRHSIKKEITGCVETRSPKRSYDMSAEIC